MATLPLRNSPVATALATTYQSFDLGIIQALIMGYHIERSDKHPENIIEEEKINMLKQWLRTIFTRLKKNHEIKCFHGFQENMNTIEIIKLLRFKILLYLIVAET